MFWNLLKYEFKNVNKWYLGLYGIVLFLSVSIGLLLGQLANGRNLLDRLQSSTSEASNAMNTIFGFTMLIFSSLLVALAISTLFLIIRRFKNSVYEREGYLTLTLPVNEHQIILSKLLGAVIWTILSTLALFLSFGIIVLIVGVASHTQFEMGTVLQFFGKHFWEIASELLKSFGYYLVALIPNILLIYLSISIGQLSQDHRAAIAFLAYFGIQFALIIAANLYVSAFPSLSTSLGSVSGVITSLLLGLIYYTGTYYILKNKVNLQ
ncbi:hypothetical protein [Streptococcus anginosus]|uniref:hypothetical protein n=1 Tax=Streptococcus anginosus TaxID=1328 RepID=UPI00066CFEF3|nr:hypothetical protein [Streptococcus anginosus]MCW0996665.1 ABC transporter ATP-binding protein [Streptococcus anginosus]